MWTVVRLNALRTGDTNLRFHITTAQDMTQMCVFNTRLFSLHNKLNYAIHVACLRMVLLTDVYRNLTSIWIKPRERAFKQFKSPALNVLSWSYGKVVKFMQELGLLSVCVCVRERERERQRGARWLGASSIIKKASLCTIISETVFCQLSRTSLTPCYWVWIMGSLALQDHC